VLGARALGPVVAVVSAAVLAWPGVASASGWAVTAAAGASGTAQSQAITTPSGVLATCTAAATAKTVTVTWSAIAHATYTVSQSSTSATTGYAVVATGLTSPTWTSGALKQNNTYWFEVSATLGGTWTSAVSAGTAGNTIHPRAPFCT
jgi:hypothetical protein